MAFWKKKPDLEPSIRDVQPGDNIESARSYENDSDLAGLDLLEQKSVLVNRALNSTGMGRYQWTIFFLCGFGYLLDLMWAQAFGLILAPLAAELNIPTSQTGEIFTAFSTGLCVGALFWGIMVDVIGRKWAFNLTTLITSAFGLVIGAPSNWAAICTLTAFCGFGLGGNIPIDATILLEFVPDNRRMLLVLLSVFQPLGVVVTSGIAWGLIPSHTCDLTLPSCFTVSPGQACCTKSSNYGWRYTMYTLGGITLFCFFLRFVVFNFRESPKFLLTQGRDDEAVKVVRSISEYNSTKCTLDMTDFAKLEHMSSRRSDASDASDSTTSYTQTKALLRQKKSLLDFSHIKSLYSSPRVAFLTATVVLVYMADYWGFSVAGSFLPKILLEKGASREISINETYRNYVIIAVVGIPGVILGSIIVDIAYIGRKWGMIISSALMAVSLFLFAVINSQAANVAFNALEYFFQSLFNAILYGYAPEIFHTNIRGTAVGLASCMGRLVSIVSPLIAAHLYATSGTNSVLYLAGGGTLVATVAALFLPETRDKIIY